MKEWLVLLSYMAGINWLVFGMPIATIVLLLKNK